MKYVVTLFFFLVVGIQIFAHTDTIGSPTLLRVHGTIRTKYEYQPSIAASRFEVRNGRVSISGRVIPTISYKAEIDLSDEGAIKMLDAYGRITPMNNLNFTIGQMRVPFTLDAHRSPHQQYFANRSFIAKQVGNVRDVGMTAGFHINQGLPCILEGGIFNGSGLTNQKEWHKELNYSVKVQLFPTERWNISLSTQKIKPHTVKIYMHDIGIYYDYQNFHLEGEYLFKHYAGKSFQDVHAIDAFAAYRIKLPKIFNALTLLARYDMMTDHSDGKQEELPGELVITDYQRQRITGGITCSFTRNFIADIRLNYEKYFYKKSGIPKEPEQDKLVLELMVRF